MALWCTKTTLFYDPVSAKVLWLIAVSYELLLIFHICATDYIRTVSKGIIPDYSVHLMMVDIVTHAY